MYKKLLGIINDDFDAKTDHLLIICSTLVKVNLPCSINIVFFFSRDVFQRLNWMHTKISHNTQTALGFWKDVGRLNNRKGWQFAGDGGSAQFIVTICSNGQLCVAELVHGLIYILKRGLYVISRYIYTYKVKQAWRGPERSRRLRLPDFKTFGTQRW